MLRRYRQNRVRAKSCIGRSWAACGLLLCFIYAASAASYDDSADTLNAYLAQEKISISNSNDDAKSLSSSLAPITPISLAQAKQQNTTMQALIRAKIASLGDFLSAQREEQHNLTGHLKKLQQLPLEKSQNSRLLEERTNHIHARLAEIDKTSALIGENIVLAKAYQTTLQAEQSRLDLLQANLAEQKQLDQLRERIHALKRTRNALYQKNIAHQKESKSNIPFAQRLNEEARLLLNNQAIILLQHQIIGLSLQKKLISADYLLLKKQDVSSIESVTESYKLGIQQLAGIEKSLKKMLALLDSEKAFFSHGPLKEQFLSIRNIATSRLNDVLLEQDVLQKNLEKKQAQLNKQLGSRKHLAEYHFNSWPMITSQLLQIPTQLYNYIKLLALKTTDNYLRQSSWSVAFLWGSLAFILLAAGTLGRVLHTVVQGKERSNISGHLYDGVLVLFYRNIPHLALAGALMVVFYLNQVVFANYRLLFNVWVVWLTFRNLILIARLMLLERISDASGRDVTLYYRLRWLLLMGGWSTTLMILSHQLPLSLLLQDIFNRLFMLFLLAVSWVAWKSRDMVPYLLWPVLKTKKRYLRNAISLLVELIPLTLLTTAVIGLVGYIDLAWTMSRYQAYILLVLTTYVLLRGVLLDALEWMSKWMIASLHNGWLWIEVILKPCDAILRVSLVLLAVVVLFQGFGWSTQSHVVQALLQMGQYPFINLSGARITLFSALAFVALLFVFIWFAKWTREFCYRWLYRQVSDPGVRNSLSVFTQYAVVLAGGLLTLRVLGIDFTGMAIVFGGLAVGMGFGLRDFASNIVGGIMLLIERPVREGDVITLGEYEGRVAHIGIRAMRVSSWDNMEVLIPNAETFSKPFTNWTLQDNIVRTVVPVKVSRADDPGMVQRLISDVLVIIPEVLSVPEPQVLLKKIDDVLIEFEIRYFINVQNHTRFEVRSNVLFAIMAQFKAAGVKSPIPSLSVELNEPARHDAITPPAHD